MIIEAILKERYVPCRTCLISVTCSKLCPIVDEMLKDDIRPIIKEMEAAIREGRQWKTLAKLV